MNATTCVPRPDLAQFVSEAIADSETTIPAFVVGTNTQGDGYDAHGGGYGRRRMEQIDLHDVAREAIAKIEPGAENKGADASSPSRAESEQKPVAMLVVSTGLQPISAEGVRLSPKGFTPEEAQKYPRIDITGPLIPPGGAWEDALVLGAARIASALQTCWEDLKLYQIERSNDPNLEAEKPDFDVINRHGSIRIHWGRSPGDEDIGEGNAEAKIGHLRKVLNPSDLKTVEGIVIDLRAGLGLSAKDGTRLPESTPENDKERRDNTADRSDIESDNAVDLQRLVKLAEEKLELTRVQFQAGVASLASLLAAERELVEATLKAAGDNLPKQLDVLDALVQNRQKDVQRVKQEYEAGTATESQVVDAQAALLEAQVRQKTVRQKIEEPT